MRDDPSALMRDGEALLVAGDLGRAARSFRRAITIAPRFGEAYLALSDTLIDERPEEAVAVLQRVLDEGHFLPRVRSCAPLLQARRRRRRSSSAARPFSRVR